jgi:hypothetical protein
LVVVLGQDEVAMVSGIHNGFVFVTRSLMRAQGSEFLVTCDSRCFRAEDARRVWVKYVGAPLALSSGIGRN